MHKLNCLVREFVRDELVDEGLQAENDCRSRAF